MTNKIQELTRQVQQEAERATYQAYHDGLRIGKLCRAIDWYSDKFQKVASRKRKKEIASFIDEALEEHRKLLGEIKFIEKRYPYSYNIRTNIEPLYTSETPIARNTFRAFESAIEDYFRKIKDSKSLKEYLAHLGKEVKEIKR